MGLLTTDIKQIRRGSLTGVTLQPPYVNDQQLNPTQELIKPPTNEEAAYNKLAAKNPLLATLTERFSLVVIKASEPAPVTPADRDKVKLRELAGKILPTGELYSKADILTKIQEYTKVTQERADKGFNLFLQSGAIIRANKAGYYLLSENTPY